MVLLLYGQAIYDILVQVLCAAGGIISLIKSLPLIITTFRDAIKGIKGSSSNSGLRTEADMNMKIVGIAVLATIVAIAIFPDVPVSILGAFLIAIFGFFLCNRFFKNGWFSRKQQQPCFWYGYCHTPIFYDYT